MANSTSHSFPEGPIYGARYTLPMVYTDATGAPTDPSTPDTEISIDGGTFTDCTEEVGVTTGGPGLTYLTLTSEETKGALLLVQGKCAAGVLTSPVALQVNRFGIVEQGTAQAGAAGTITLAAGASAVDGYYNGAIIRTTGGTGGASGGCQARRVNSYVGSTRVATVVPNWETTPGADTTYDVLTTRECPNKVPSALVAPAATALSSATWTGTKAGYIDVAISGRAAPGAQMDLVNAPNATAVVAVNAGMATAAALAAVAAVVAITDDAARQAAWVAFVQSQA